MRGDSGLPIFIDYGAERRREIAFLLLAEFKHRSGLGQFVERRAVRPPIDAQRLCRHALITREAKAYCLW
jgi:hypothetical protein